MPYVKATGGTVLEYPFNVNKLRSDNPNVSFPSEFVDTLLAKFNVYPVVASNKPEVTVFERTVETNPVLTNGVWVQQWQILPAQVPKVITPRQCRLILLQQGLLATVEAMIAQQDEATRITWEYATEFRRDDPLLVNLATTLNLSNQQIDQFFIAASQL